MGNPIFEPPLRFALEEGGILEWNNKTKTFDLISHTNELSLQIPLGRTIFKITNSNRIKFWIETKEYQVFLVSMEELKEFDLFISAEFMKMDRIRTNVVD